VDAQARGRQGYALCVIARRRRQHTVPPLLLGEAGDFVVRAAQFERKDRLFVLSFEEQLTAETCRQAGRAL